MRLQARYESCYIHVMQVLKFLIDPGVAEGSGATVQQQARMSDADRNAARRTLLQVPPLVPLSSEPEQCICSHVAFHMPLMHMRLRQPPA